MPLDPRIWIALLAGSGAALLVAASLRWRRRTRMHSRVRALADAWSKETPTTAMRGSERTSTLAPRLLAGRLGARLAERMPAQVGRLHARIDRAGLGGGSTTVELLGWKALTALFGAALGIASTIRYGAVGLVVLVLGILIGWFGLDVMLARHQAQRRRLILRDLPTVMDLLVLSLEAGMGLDRALRTIIREYRSVLGQEIERVMIDIDLGVGRGEAFERMAVRVGLADLRSLSRAIVQAEELGVSLVGAMQTQSQQVRLSRRRAAEAEALRAPIKMLVPLVVFILPTLFMLLIGPVGLRAGSALAGAGVP